MDELTKEKLQSLRSEVPRYLFRAWNDTPRDDERSRVSGGHVGGNTTEAITPLYFLQGGQKSSPYELTKLEFMNMTFHHLVGLDGTFKTEFSSWTASLSYALLNIGWTSLGGFRMTPENNIHISIIDTTQLTNEIFYVPSLTFLHPTRYHYPHEFLVHGVVRGPAHKAVPMHVFWTNGIIHDYPRVSNRFFSKDGKLLDVRPMSTRAVAAARKVGEAYGGDIALPVCLAILTQKPRDSYLFREGSGRLDVLFEGIEGLAVPETWEEDEALKLFVERVLRFEDVEQCLRLMKAVVKQYPVWKEEKKEIARAESLAKKSKDGETEKLERARREQAEKARVDAENRRLEEEKKEKEKERLEEEARLAEEKRVEGEGAEKKKKKKKKEEKAGKRWARELRRLVIDMKI